MSAGARLWQALEEERPLQVVGTINAYSALLAQRAGFKALYLSGAGVDLVPEQDLASADTLRSARGAQGDRSGHGPAA